MQHCGYEKKTCPFFAPTQVEFMTSMTLMCSRPFSTKNEHKSWHDVQFQPKISKSKCDFGPFCGQFFIHNIHQIIIHFERLLGILTIFDRDFIVRGSKS